MLLEKKIYCSDDLDNMQFISGLLAVFKTTNQKILQCKAIDPKKLFWFFNIFCKQFSD